MQPPVFSIQDTAVSWMRRIMRLPAGGPRRSRVMWCRVARS